MSSTAALPGALLRRLRTGRSDGMRGSAQAPAGPKLRADAAQKAHVRFLAMSSRPTRGSTGPSGGRGYGARVRAWDNRARTSVSMPRIHDNDLDVVVFLFPDAAAARTGDQAGGTGFLVGVPLVTPWYQIYVVTCSHVVKEGRAPVIRVNTRSGGAEVIDVPADAWIHHPDGDDLAIHPIDMDDEHRWACVHRDQLLTEVEMNRRGIGPGDDVFMVGRFIYHDGGLSNKPAARFGNLAMMPERIKQEARAGFMQESFLVECRSLSGFSGSPVFVQVNGAIPRPHGAGVWDRQPPSNPKVKLISQTTNEVRSWLLGVDWGHVQSRERAIGPGATHFWTPNSGMAAVVPVWRLDALLDLPELVRKREEETRRLEAEGLASRPLPP